VEFDASSGKWDPASSDGPDTLAIPIDISRERFVQRGIIKQSEKVAGDTREKSLMDISICVKSTYGNILGKEDFEISQRYFSRNVHEIIQ